ncbi:MAG: PilZ domain-containing protein [Beijerinckiaceae bacterium]
MHRRVRVHLLGRYMLETRQEFPCQAIDMSPGGLLLKAPAIGHLGERVIVYLEQLGRIEGRISRVVPGGFAIAIATTMRKRDKLASQLTWLANRSVLGLPEDRRHTRIVPRNPLAVVTLPDGGAVNVRLIDVSMSGAAFSGDMSFEKGMAIIIGSTPARVVRVTENGIAAEFVNPVNPERFDENIIL